MNIMNKSGPLPAGLKALSRLVILELSANKIDGPIPEAIPKPESNPDPETRTPKPGSRKPKLQTPNPKHQTPNPNPYP